MSSHNRGAGGWRFREDLCPKKRPQRKPAGRRAVTSYKRPRTPGLEWNFPQVARDRCELISLDRGCLGSVWIQDSHPGLIVIQAWNGPIRFD
jgi:hypothetical protein